jgi:hypothetical protein
VPIVLKSGSLNLLEPSGPVKACNGIYDNNFKFFMAMFIDAAPSHPTFLPKEHIAFDLITSLRRNLKNRAPNKVMLISKKLKNQKNVSKFPMELL